MAKQKSKLVILDGNALIHRSFHALPLSLQTKNGQAVNAVYGFTSFLLKAIKEFKPGYIALTLDKAGPTFRHEKFAKYKATRTKAPDELYAQIPIVKEVAKAFNIPVYEKAGFEADDLIGTIVKKVDGRIDKIIVTGDMDTLQLVDDDVFVFAMSHGIADSLLYNRSEVYKKYGFGPEQVIDYKALRGDPSDNIPGVPGIGEKTATELIKKFKTLDNLYQKLPKAKIKDRTRQLLLDHQEHAYLSQELATIDCRVDIDFDLADVKFGDYQQEKIMELFSQLEFKSLLPRLKNIDDNFVAKENKLEQTDKFTRNRRQFKYQLIDNDKDFASFLTKLAKQSEFTIDTETSDLDSQSADLLGISFSWQEGEAYYLNIRSQRRQPAQAQGSLFAATTETASDRRSWLEKLRPILANDKIKKHGHNLKFDIKVLQSYGLEVKGLAFDTMIASYLLNPGNRQHGLDAVVFTELGFVKISKEDLLGTGKQKLSFGQVPVENLSLYSCEDADFTHRLVNKLSLHLQAEKLERLFLEMELPLVGVLARMEQAGVAIDQEYFKDLGQQLDKKIKSLQKKIWQLGGKEFNISSVQQLREVLFAHLKISSEGIGKTKTGLSTGAEELTKLLGAHPIIEPILEYRELTKLNSTYVQALPELINPLTKRVHTNFNQAVTATGRLSSNNPNLQNIPVRTDWGKQIRQGFVAPRGRRLVSLDYSQIELRLAAHVAGDPKMIKAFKEGLDIHQATAAEINKVPLSEVTKEMRRNAKAVNFGIIYGQGPRGLSLGTGLPYEEAKQFIDNYFAVYGKIREYIDQTIAKAREEGYVETLFHRRRYLGDINSSMALVRKSAERMAINAPLQGSAADMIKAAMIQIDNLLQKKYKEEILMILQVHDELVFEMPADMVDKVVPALKQIMENIIKLDVPIVVDVKVGQNWDKMTAWR